MNVGLAKHLDRVLGGWWGRWLGGWDRAAELLHPPGEVSEVRRVLVVKFWGLGNWALLRPVVQDLRSRHPGAHFTIATLAGNAPLVRDLADDLLLVRPETVRRTVLDLAAAVRRLRRAPPDLAVDFEQFARSGALLARLGRARQRVGFRTGSAARDGLYTVTVPFRDDVHVTRSFRDLVEAAGVAPAAYVPGGLQPTEAGLRETASLRECGPYVVLHPGSGDNFPGRRWSVSGFAAAGRCARDAGRRVFVTGGGAESELVERAAAAVGEGAEALAGRLSVHGLVALLAGADALLSNDTGPVHIASQLGTPVLAMFGPNTPTLYGPLSASSHAFYRALPCSPCTTVANYRSSRCRIYTCMASIPVGEVVERMRALLAKSSHGAGVRS
ncbi:MAG: glycosyltransferase family 9 protein [Planctomycetota bacterium]|nr:glycosyltransferase family 9 protein [Planctomycetota bacterium]